MTPQWVVALASAIVGVLMRMQLLLIFYSKSRFWGDQ